MAPLLTICIPTFERARFVGRLLTALEREIGARSDVRVCVSDNASTDETPAVLAAFAARCTWLDVHRQDENIGAVRNLRWLVEHAPESEYLWCFGDDDLPAPGAVAEVADLLAAERPRWLFLPHAWTDEAGTPRGLSPAPDTVERYPNAGELWRAQHHWTTFMSASVCAHAPMREAARATTSDNAYSQVLWFFGAGLEGPCLVAARHLVHAPPGVAWQDRMFLYQTRDFTSLYDDGLHRGISREAFARSLDGLYSDELRLGFWRQRGLDALVDAVERFPESAGLRTFLWAIAREQGRRDVLPVLARALEAAGEHDEAAALLADGETRFAAGDVQAAAQHFNAAVQRVPTLTPAWNNLAVALHALGHPDALTAVDTALFVDPDDVDARHNRAAILA